MTIREEREKLEKLMISEYGMLSSASSGRFRSEPEDDSRTCFQHDVDRIVHSKSFRRLMHKTQVFLQPEGDHYRTRMTHTLEVTRLARTVARALSLNEDLTEATALGHDLGHTPFGHAGERALNELIPGGFRHYEQSLRVVDILENGGKGLNLTNEVRIGIYHHTYGEPDDLPEAQIVRLCDKIAYINHDTDDAIRAGILHEEDIPDEISSLLGYTYSERINSMIIDLIENSRGKRQISPGPEMYFITESFHNFMYQRVYLNPEAKSEERKVLGLLSGLYESFMKNPDKLPKDYLVRAEVDGLERAVGDYIAGMTDKYAIYCYNDLFIPSSWEIM